MSPRPRDQAAPAQPDRQQPLRTSPELGGMAGLPQPPKRPVPAEPSISAPSTPPDGQQTQADIPPELLRQQPIPPPSEPKQYRAIGLVRGRYQPAEDQFNRGLLVTEDGTELDAVLLGQVMGLVKKYLNLEESHLWVVYPRTREKERSLHVQILGVWEPEELHQDSEDSAASSSYQLSDPLQDGYFSIRGEVIFQSEEQNFVLVKIQQSPRKSADRPKAFKLRLEGNVGAKSLGYFWNLEVQRQGNNLVITQGNAIGLVPPKKMPRSGQGGPKPRSRPFSREATGSSTTPVPTANEPTRKPLPKPQKRQEPRPEL